MLIDLELTTRQVQAIADFDNWAILGEFICLFAYDE